MGFIKKQETKKEEPKKLDELPEAFIIPQSEIEIPAAPKQIATEQSIVQELMKRLDRLENGYQVFNEFKEKMGSLADSDLKGKNKIKDIEEIESNIEVVFQEIRDILKIDVQGIPINDGFDQLCEWMREEPIPNYMKAAGNGFHYMQATIQLADKLKQKEEALKLLIDQFKAKLH